MSTIDNQPHAGAARRSGLGRFGWGIVFLIVLAMAAVPYVVAALAMLGK